MNKFTLHHGDCLDLMRTIPDRSVDLVLCDLPYGTTKCKWDAIIPFEPLWAEYKRITKKDAAVVLTACQPFTSALVMSNLPWFKYELIWQKSKSGSAFTAQYRPLAKHENVLVFGRGRTKYNPQMRQGEPYQRVRKPGAKNNHNLGLGKSESVSINTGERYPDSVMPFRQQWRRQDQVHPTQKPVSLMEYLILTYSDEGDTVLDNCMGSGPVGVACINTGRQFIGMEKEIDFFEIARSRIQHAADQRRAPEQIHLLDAAE